ncbi:MAG: hypothetical protein RIS86_49 [Planctomycetota bacterium]|jgi:hypothetical protein
MPDTSVDSPRRPDFAPENRSRGAGRLIAVSVFALLLIGAAATLVVVLNRGRSGVDVERLDPRGAGAGDHAYAPETVDGDGERRPSDD